MKRGSKAAPRARPAVARVKRIVFKAMLEEMAKVRSGGEIFGQTWCDVSSTYASQLLE
jgi:hypothetical protein